MINTYYNRLKHLRIAQPYVNDISMLQRAYSIADKTSAISLVSYISVKYEDDLQKIAFYISARPVARGNLDELYIDYTPDDFYEDLDYLSKCIVVIALVRLKMVPSLESILEEIFYEDDY